MALRSLINRWVPALCLTTLVLSCDSPDGGVLAPGEIPGPNFEVYDGSMVNYQFFEDANPHFFFLPPLVKNPTTTGVFDNGLTVEVNVFECGLVDVSNPNGELVLGRRMCYSDGTPPPLTATFSMEDGTGGATVKVLDESYQVNWDTDDFLLQSLSSNGTKFYRIIATSIDGGLSYPLGHVDIQFAPNRKQALNLNEEDADLFALNDGRTLPIKFRIEEFAATFAEQSSCHADGGAIIDCDVRTLDPDDDNPMGQQLVVWADEDEREPAGVVTFTPGSVPEGVVAVLKYAHPTGWPPSGDDQNEGPSPEIPDTYEIPPFLTVDLFNEDGTQYVYPPEGLGGDGARLAWCHDLPNEDEISSFAIYKVDGEGDSRNTVVMATGIGDDCGYAEFAYAAPREKDTSLLGRLREGLSRVTSVLTPQPLRAMHGGLNTEGPIKRFSDFGAVALTAAASAANGSLGEPTEITIWLNQGLLGAGGPLGGENGDYVGPYVDDEDNPLDDLIDVTIISGPNQGGLVSEPEWNGDGSFTAWYTPDPLNPTGTDLIRVTVNTQADIFAETTSQVYSHESCAVAGVIDCDVQPLEVTDDEGPSQRLAVWADVGGGQMEPAGAVTFSPGSIPSEGITAVLKYIDPAVAGVSPEIDDQYEIPPFMTVELWQETGGVQVLYTDSLFGEGAKLTWCHIDDEKAPTNANMEKYAIYKVDDGNTVVMETKTSGVCAELEAEGQVISASRLEPDGSLLGILREGLHRVASVFSPEPLRAMHGGLNTEGPIKRFSDFGVVEITADFPVPAAGELNEPTTIIVWLNQGLQGAGGPLGGFNGNYVGLYVDADNVPRDNLIDVAVTAGPNTGAPVTDPVHNTDGSFTVTYTPKAYETTPDQITVTVNTLGQQQKVLYSQVAEPVELCGTAPLAGCAVREVTDIDQPQVLRVVNENGGHTAGVLTLEEGSLPVEGMVAVLKYIAAVTGVSPEIDDQYEIPPFMTVDLFNPDGSEFGDDPDEVLDGDYGAKLAWCHDDEVLDYDIDKLAIYQVDDGETVLLETMGGASECELWGASLQEQVASNTSTEPQSLWGTFRDGLTRVASVLKPEPLKAMHGGLNTEGPIKRFSDFGAVELTPWGSVSEGVAGSPTTVTVELQQAGEQPLGNYDDNGFTGPTSEPGHDLVVIELADANWNPIGGPLPVTFNGSNGEYTAVYPHGSGTDYILVTVGTSGQDTLHLTSDVVAATGTLNVTVGGTPAAEITVTLTLDGASPSAITSTTDANGVTTFANLPPGAYTVSAPVEGVTAQAQVTVQAGVTTSVTLEPVITITDVRFSDTNLVIGAAGAATFQLTINNGKSTTLTGLTVAAQLWQDGVLDQFGQIYIRGEGGGPLRCSGAPAGELPAGAQCSDVSDHGFNTTQPSPEGLNWNEGPATARIELWLSDGTPIAFFEVPVNLQAETTYALEGSLTGYGGIEASLDGQSWEGLISAHCELEVDGTQACVSGTQLLTYPAGTTVYLRAVPYTGREWSSWSGCDSATGPNDCTVVMNAARTVSATFTQTSNVLLGRALGWGDITATAGGVTQTLSTGSCSTEPGGPEVCTHADTPLSFAPGTVVTLQAYPAPGWGFYSNNQSWAGCTPTTPDALTCQVTMGSDLTMSFTFDKYNE